MWLSSPEDPRDRVSVPPDFTRRGAPAEMSSAGQTGPAQQLVSGALRTRRWTARVAAGGRSVGDRERCQPFAFQRRPGRFMDHPRAGFELSKRVHSMVCPQDACVTSNPCLGRRAGQARPPVARPRTVGGRRDGGPPPLLMTLRDGHAPTPDPASPATSGCRPRSIARQHRRPIASRPGPWTRRTQE